MDWQRKNFYVELYFGNISILTWQSANTPWNSPRHSVASKTFNTFILQRLWAYQVHLGERFLWMSEHSKSLEAEQLNNATIIRVKDLWTLFLKHNFQPAKHREEIKEICFYVTFNKKKKILWFCTRNTRSPHDPSD